MKRHEEYMAEAIELGKKCPPFPFGAVVVDRTNGRVIARGLNDSLNRGPIWHGEMDAIQNVANLPKEEVGECPWRNLALYTTAEPCPMCQGAITWAGISMVVYGTTIESLKKFGYEQIDIKCTEVASRHDVKEGGYMVACEIVPGILEEECDALFAQASAHWTWKKN